MKWVQAATAGIDGYCKVKSFQESAITLTNAKGMYSAALAEFVALGMLFHTKCLRTYLKQQADRQWKQGFIENVYTKTVVIVGFGDIGTACGKVLKQGFGARVIGVKRRPENTPEHHKACADEIRGLTDLGQVI